MRTTLVILMLGALAISTSAEDSPKSPASKEGLRTWTDTSGEFSVRATFVKVRRGVVTLRQEDGTLLEIESKQLDKASLAALREDATKAEKSRDTRRPFPDAPAPKSAPGKAMPHIPDAAAPKTAPGKATPHKAAAARAPSFALNVGTKVLCFDDFFGWQEGTIKEIKGSQYRVDAGGLSDKWVSAQALRLKSGGLRPSNAMLGLPKELRQPSDEPLQSQKSQDENRPLTDPEWAGVADMTPGDGERQQGRFVPDPDGSAKLTPRVIPILRSGKSDSLHVGRIFIQGGRAMLDLRAWSGGDANAGLELLDLADGKSLHSWSALPGTMFAGFSRGEPDHALLQSYEGWARGQERVDLYSMDGPTVKHVAGCRPYDPVDTPLKDVAWAHLADSEHVLTMGKSADAIVMWKLPEWRAVWKVSSYHKPPITSPGGKQVAYVHQRRLHVVDVPTGTNLLQIDVPFDEITTFSFRPDGKLLAGTHLSTILLIDLEQRAIIGDIGLSGDTSGAPIWVDGDHFILENTLFSAGKRSPLWNYRFAGIATDARPVTSGGVLWFVDKGVRSGPSLVGAQLPTQEALEAEKQTDARTNAIPRGTKVTLQIDVGADSADVTAALTKNAAAAGWEVVPEGGFLLRAGRKEHPQKVSYKNWKDSKVSEVTVTTSSFTLQLLGPGKKVLWETASANTLIAYHIKVQQGESVQAAAERETAAWSKPGWFSSVRLPTHIPLNASLENLGTTEISAAGFRRVK